MRRRKGYVPPTAALAVVAAAAVFGGAANVPSVVAGGVLPPDESLANFHDDSSRSANRKDRIRKRQYSSNHLPEEQKRKLGLLADLHNHADYISTKNEAMVAGRSESRHRIRRHNSDDLESILTKLLAAEPVNTVVQTDVLQSQMAPGRNSDSSTVYSTDLFPRDGHQQLILVGDVITVQTTQADIPTDFIVGANNQVFDTSSGQPVAVQNIFWDQSTRGFVDSSGNEIPVDISVEYVSDSGSYFSGDSTQGRYEIRNGQLYYIRADGTAINTGFTIEAGTNELIFIDAGSADRTGVAYRESDEQFILISSGEVVQFEITTETITTVEDKVTEGQIVVETGAGNFVIEENSGAVGGVVGGGGNGNGGDDDSSDDDCKSENKSTVQSYRGKGRSKRRGGKGRYRRHRSRGKGKGRSYSKSSKKKKSKSSKSSKGSSKSSKGSRRLAEADIDDEVGSLRRYLKSSKGSKHSKSSKSSYSGKGKGRSYSGKGGGKGYSSSRSKKKKKTSRKKKKDRCD